MCLFFLPTAPSSHMVGGAALATWLVPSVVSLPCLMYLLVLSHWLATFLFLGLDIEPLS